MLGTTLWEMTTMRRLFKRDDDAETIMAVRAGLVPDPRATVRTYPEELWHIVRRTLRRDRDERYATAAELAADLDAFVASTGGDEDMPLLGGAILDALFPGEREKRALWLKSANVPRKETPRTTFPPPATVVGAHTPSMVPPPRSTRSSSRPPPAKTPSRPPPRAPASSPPEPAKKPRSVPKIRVPRG
jgi:serine/threonine-protein kinase